MVGKLLAIGDVRAERNRHLPIVTQRELAAELGWAISVIGPVETRKIEASQEQLQAMLDAIQRIVARRAEADA